MNLSELQTDQKAVIVKVKGQGAFRKRITEMGFVKGKEVLVIKNAPLKDPIEYQIMGYEISLRRSESELIEVSTESDFITAQFFEGVISEEKFRESVHQKTKNIHVAFVGNPNSGKTTLFNHASGSNEHVGNYSGVTVDAKKARFSQHGYTFDVVDLPGTYSLTAYSPEELYVRNYISEQIPDIVVNVVDASNMERNMYLTTQLIDMNIKVVMALNMYDELEKKGDVLNVVGLAKMIGIPIVPTVGSKGEGVTKLFDTIIRTYEDLEPTQRQIRINYGAEAEIAIDEIDRKIALSKNQWLTDKLAPRFLAIKLLEKDEQAVDAIEKCENQEQIKKTAKKEITRLERIYKEDSETVLTDAKYGFIAGALGEMLKQGKEQQNQQTKIIDTFVTHKLFGLPLFVLFIWVMFQSTFSFGQYPMEWIDQGVGLLGDLIAGIMSDGTFKDLIIDGVIGGVGGVIIFLPNILILFFFISFMEDTGYMARVAFIMDKVMHLFGLHGKSFIPLIMGFGCNVPAIMATRTLENRQDRLLTMLINPFMSCSARLPVYLVIAGAVFPNNAGTVIFSIYIFGIFMAFLVAVLLKKIIFKSEEAPFVMELPPYRIPSLKTTIRHMWHKGSQYLKKMGGVILVASILVWALGYFPRQHGEQEAYEQNVEKLQTNHEQQLVELNNEEQNKRQQQHDSVLLAMHLKNESIRQEQSYIGRIGHFVEPAIAPLGFDWKMGVSIVSGIAAKEIVVSTMGVLYQADADQTENLKEKLKKERYNSGVNKGKLIFTPSTAYAFLIFILIYFPCIATVAVVQKESGSWKWAAFMVFYTTTLAWTMAFIVKQIGDFIL